MNASDSPRRVTVTFEGADSNREDFTFTRTVSATKGGDNPRFYGEQITKAVGEAAATIRAAVEATYGRPPTNPL